MLEHLQNLTLRMAQSCFYLSFIGLWKKTLQMAKKLVKTIRCSSAGMFAAMFVIMVAYHLPQIPGNSGWDVNGKWFFGSSHWKIPRTNRNSEKVVPFSWLGRSEWKLVYHLQVSWVLYQFHVVTRIQYSAARQSENFRQMVNDCMYHSYRPKIFNQNFRNFFYKW